MITYDYYRIFYFVARYKSFTKAAKMLGNNQPNITRCMNILEQELKCTLFLRSNRGISLTPEGKKLYEHVAIAYEQLQIGEEEIRQICKELKMEEIDDTMGKGKLIDEIFGEFCEGSYIQPTFITDYPVEMSPLTKMHRSKPGLTERFELMVNGKELANAYSELNDPLDQEERFKEQMRLADKGDDEAMIIDQDFLRSLQYGMPPTSGIGIGIDRLVMLMTGQTTIQEVLFFPQMRPEKVVKKDAAAKYMELGIAEDWVPVIQKAGYNTVEDMKDVNAQKLHQDICGINKKYKLELANPSVNDVTDWIQKIK